jgi:hypothetical protein
MSREIANMSRDRRCDDRFREDVAKGAGRAVRVRRPGWFVASVRANGAAIGGPVRATAPGCRGPRRRRARAGRLRAGRPPAEHDEPKGEYAQKIFNLSWPVFLIAGVVGVLVFATLIVTFIRFRERPAHMATPKQVHGNPALEIGLTILPAILLAAIAVPTVKVLFELNATPKDPLVVNVFGQQWWWEFDYPPSRAATTCPWSPPTRWSSPPAAR